MYLFINCQKIRSYPVSIKTDSLTRLFGSLIIFLCYLTAFRILRCGGPIFDDDCPTPDPELRSPFRTESAATASWVTTAAILRITNNVDGRLLLDCCSYFLYNIPIVSEAVKCECVSHQR